MHEDKTLYDNYESYLSNRNSKNWWKDLKKTSPRYYQYWEYIEVKTTVKEEDLYVDKWPTTVYPIYYFSCHNTGYWHTNYDDYPLLYYTDPSYYEHVNNRWINLLKTRLQVDYFSPPETISKLNDYLSSEQDTIYKKRKASIINQLIKKNKS